MKGAVLDAGGLEPLGPIEVVDLVIAVRGQMVPIVVDDPLAALTHEGPEGLGLDFLTVDELKAALDQLAEDP